MAHLVKIFLFSGQFQYSKCRMKTGASYKRDYYGCLCSIALLLLCDNSSEVSVRHVLRGGTAGFFSKCHRRE